ncbi:MAG TPA: cytochrome c-type biogenesis CcmF C-terminal domain-containing protein [Candidatus Kryptonia bacterium]
MEQYLTIIPLLASAASIVYYSLSHRREDYIRPARMFFLAGFYTTVILYAYFLFLIFSHQYQYSYVWSYSANNLSVPLLFSTSYAGQEGSLFLWLFFTAVISIFVLRYSRKHKYESTVIPVILLFEIFVLAILTLKSPFMKVWESFANVPYGTQPQDGRGLNPLLQNFWIVIHPPILFLGFASAIVPFAYAVAGLVKKDYLNWTGYLQPWLVMNVLTLGAGIIIGGYWAYVTLGWGGFWGWDPVENSSLIPWLFSAAALHTVIVARRTRTYLKTSFVFVIFSFVLVLYSTFLTRSGVLGDTSVHAFMDPGKSIYILLLILIGTFALLGFVPFFKNRISIPSAGVSHNLLSRENALFVGAASLSVLSLFVLVGTSSPIITGLLQGKPTAVDSSYYVTTSLPLGLLIIALIGLGQLVWWDKSDKNAFTKSLALPGSVGILTAIIALLLSVTNVVAVITIGVASFAFTAHAAALVRIVKGNPRYIGGPIAHAGLALIFIGIITSTALETKTTVQLPQGKTVNVLGQQLTYTGNTKVDGRDAFKVVLKGSNGTSELRPVMYYSDYNQGTMREPDIKSYLAYDIYVSPMEIENGSSGNLGAGGVGLVTVVKGKPTTLADGTKLLLTKFDMNTSGHTTMQQGGSFGVGAVIEASKGGKSIEVVPSLSFTNGKQNAVPATAFGDMLIIMSMNVGMGAGSPATVNLAVHSGDMSAASVPTLTAEVSRKPLIGLLWAGTIILFIGLAISMYRRFTEETVARRLSRSDFSASRPGVEDHSQDNIRAQESEHKVQENVEN